MPGPLCAFLCGFGNRFRITTSNASLRILPANGAPCERFPLQRFTTAPLAEPEQRAPPCSNQTGKGQTGVAGIKLRCLPSVTLRLRYTAAMPSGASLP